MFICLYYIFFLIIKRRIFLIFDNYISQIFKKKTHI